MRGILWQFKWIVAGMLLMQAVHSSTKDELSPPLPPVVHALGAARSQGEEE